MRFAFLLTQLSSYLAVCLRELAALPETSVLVTCLRPADTTPYVMDEVTPAGVLVHRYGSLPEGRSLLEEISGFDPHVLVVSGWQTRPFRHVARRRAGATLRVLLMDNQWLGTPKQWLGIITAPIYIRPVFDVAFLPGERQAVFARKLGFAHARIWRGMNSCDHERFSQAMSVGSASASTGRRGFVFAGRLVEEKGLTVLAEAYERYRTKAGDPWPLLVCGSGPLEYLFDGVQGVERLGFVQPVDLPRVFAGAGCLVMPSLFEPWGVAIHEATAAGLPVICSSACGAAPHLVEDGVNGYVVAAGSVTEMVDAMVKCSELDPDGLSDMRFMSSTLSKRYTPARWASLVRSRADEALKPRQNEVH